MRRIILAIATFIFCLFGAEVRVEKVLETTSVKEYNQWVKKNRAKYPGLKPIYIQTEIIKGARSRAAVDYEPEKTFDPSPDNPFINEYRIRYYNENGDVVKEEIIRGYVAVRVSLNFDEVLINKRDHPWYPENRINIVKDKRGNIKIIRDDVFSLIFTGIEGLYIEEADYECGSEYLRLFDKNGNVIGTLEGASRCMVTATSADGKFIIDGYAQEPNWKPGLLFLYAKNGVVLWRKEFAWQEGAPQGLYPSISGDGNVIAVGHIDKVYVYKRNGEVWQEYGYNPPYPALSALSYDGRFLAIVTREAGTKVMLCDNEKGEIVWTKRIEGLTPSTCGRSIVISPDGRYVGVMMRPDKVYLFGENGQILKQWDLGGIVAYAVASGGKRVEVPLTVFTILQFINNLLIIKYTNENPDFKTDCNYIIEKVVKNE